ncbi:HAD hydrolase-like protein [Megasphaera vaginalis (ex Bordigoni et al. 2020)]|uniref:HAD hydrolase-like protein n=1 Tax=Megasphaera vaginalis (ex Bordigoni et al. 2020) TaxID=2045301 RepID=UPI000C7A767F|nr:HAD hydrolase-like protein [Megasphaera vaginalis (ex Bordigoni et al. 2020)]
MYRHILFDLDGTLTDSQEGIIKSVAYALEKQGEATAGRLEQQVIIGPPLMLTFLDTFGFSPEKAQATYAFFQERYGTIGKFENRPFAGIIHMLRQLQSAGSKAYVATSKPQVHAEAICEKFGLSPYLTEIAGSVLGGTEDKAVVIDRVLRHIGSGAADSAVMVGDRKYDVIGARKTGIPVIYAAFGYGNEAERQEFPADYTVNSVAELTALLLHS